MKTFITMFVLSLFLSCSSSKEVSNTPSAPNWLEERIASHLSTPPATPPIRIEACLWQGDTVYHESAPCCDQFTTLFDQDGTVICAPTGGITGQGDGKCPGFRSGHTVLYTVWEDDRNN